MYKNLYSKFLSLHSDKLHFACHSHHYWPDVTREAQVAYWDDAARFVDEKWNFILSEKVAALEKHLSKILQLPLESNWAWAASTHDLTLRLVSLFPWNQTLEILTTDSEFHSFGRQLKSWVGAGKAKVKVVPVEPFQTFPQRFVTEAKKQHFDMIYFSQVFYNSGYTVNLDEVLPHLPSTSMIVVDAYHAFMAIPTNLATYADKVIYLAGGYKYAQGGEGACFMWVPAKFGNPVQTGWYAGFADLSKKTDSISYASGGARFAGATMDYTAVYRQLAVFDLFEKMDLRVSVIHEHIQKCQKAFLEALRLLKNPIVDPNSLLFFGWQNQGHFLTFELGDIEKTEQLQKELLKRGFWTDSRGSRLRFGFGLYHEPIYDLSGLNAD